jgi:hypothetical protein
MIEAAVDVVAVDAVGVQVEDSVSVVEEADVAVDVEEAAVVIRGKLLKAEIRERESQLRVVS